ncbi:sensor histidine kinase [Deinococcus hohokamensis]|uniref:histidine kinase n=1 Tax=Deinococcus hohokamensis TaxID=309883 RepID=A0ABV9I854_9DEIO
MTHTKPGSPAAPNGEERASPPTAEAPTSPAEPAPGFLQQVHDLSADCIKVVDAQGRLKSMNRRGQEAMQVDDLSLCLGSDWRLFWQGEAEQAMHSAFEAARAGRPAQFRGFCPTLKGEARWWDVTIAPLDTETGDLIVMSRDITAQMEAQRQLAELNTHLEQEVQRRTRALGQERRQLQQLNEDLQALTYSISHDLRTPVRHVQSFLRLANVHRADATRQQRYLEIAERSAGQLASMIDSVLQLTRIGRVELRRQLVDLNAVLRSVRVELQAEQGDRTVLWDAPDLPTVYGDGALLQVALKVMCANALKFTRPVAEPRIELRARRLDGAWQLEVRDNGVGFEPTYTHKLFGLFRRLHRPDDFEGLGAGLAVLRRIAQRHGGEVGAHGTVGGGATFTLTLPDPEEEL